MDNRKEVKVFLIASIFLLVGLLIGVSFTKKTYTVTKTPLKPYKKVTIQTNDGRVEYKYYYKLE